MSISLKELQENAKYLAFPSYNKVNDTSCYFCDERHEWVKLPPTGGVYKGWKGNEHHYTTEYHRQYVLPTLESMFHFGYKESDFTVRKNVLLVGNNTFDLSYQVPKENKLFKVDSLDYGLTYFSGFPGLLKNSRTRDLTWFTEYHNLFCLPHSSSIVTNLKKNNGRSLLILGDSQLIPSLPVLCQYYESVTYVDNRRKINVAKMLKPDYDDILIEIFAKRLRYYLEYLREDLK